MAITDSNLAIPRQKNWAPRARTGCATCRQRRIKCDEHKPICNRCRKAQRKCLGTDYDPQSCALTSRRPGSPGLDVTADVRDILHLAPFLCSELIARKSQIGNTRQFSPFALSGGRDLVSYMHYLPQTCGGGGVLDIATSCVAQAVRKLCTEHFQLRLHPSEASEQDETRHLQALYAEALKRLQLALQDSECSLQVETLCATILLCTFESLRGENQSASIQHAKGTAELIRYRGAHRFTTDFEKTLFASQIGNISTMYYFERKASFLNSSEWHEVMHSSVNTLRDDQNSIQLAVECQVKALPSFEIFWSAIPIVLEQRHMPNFRWKCVRLLHHLTQEKDKLLDWMKKVEKNELATNISQDSRIPTSESPNESYINALLVGKTVLITQHRFCILLGACNSYDLEHYTSRLAMDTITRYRQYCETTNLQAVGQMLLPVCNAVLNTTTQWKACFNSNAEFGGSNLPVDMIRSWLLQTAMSPGASVKKHILLQRIANRPSTDYINFE